MNNIIKLGLLSSLLSATLLADITPYSSAKILTKTKTQISLYNLSDPATGKSFAGKLNFTGLSVDKGSKIDGMSALTNGDYTFDILHTEKCTSEIKGVFTVVVNGKKVQEPYTMCKESSRHFETSRPYKNNEKQEQVLSLVKDDRISIIGETEANYDFVTITDMSGKVLTADIWDPISKKYEPTKLKFSGKLVTHISKLPVGNVKVLFSSDGSTTKEGVKVDVLYAPRD